MALAPDTGARPAASATFARSGKSATRPIAYSYGDGPNNRSIYVVNPDGSGVQQLTNDVEPDHDPAWSPDYRRVAFVRGGSGLRKLIVMTARGTRPTPLLEGGLIANPSWSPDGQWIAFDMSVGSYTDIYTIRADGSELRRITTTGAQNTNPSWSPDGGRIAYVSMWSGSREIWVMNADGVNPTRLTSCAAVLLECSDPAWSPVPGDERIAYMSVGNGQAAVRIATTTGGLSTVYVGTQQPEVAPAWSPDGTMLVFADRFPLNAYAELFTINADGTGLSRITYSAEGDLEPAWSR